MDMGTISAAISGFNAALKLAKEAIAARDQRLMEKAESELTKELLQITQAALALGNENTAIMQRNRDLEEQESQAERVCERSVGVQENLYRTRRGGVCYRAKTGVQGGDFPVCLCANCVAEGVKTYLQPTGAQSELECRRGHRKKPTGRVVTAAAAGPD